MKKFNRFAAAAMSAVMAASLLAGCSKSAEESQAVTTAAEGSQAEETKAEEGGAEETEAKGRGWRTERNLCVYPRQRRPVLLGQHGRRRRQSS